MSSSVFSAALTLPHQNNQRSLTEPSMSAHFSPHSDRYGNNMSSPDCRRSNQCTSGRSTRCICQRSQIVKAPGLFNNSWPQSQHETLHCSGLYRGVNWLKPEPSLPLCLPTGPGQMQEQSYVTWIERCASFSEIRQKDQKVTQCNRKRKISSVMLHMGQSPQSGYFRMYHRPETSSIYSSALCYFSWLIIIYPSTSKTKHCIDKILTHVECVG